MATTNYCVIPYLRGKTSTQKAWKSERGGYYAVDYCIPVHFNKTEGLSEGAICSRGKNGMLAPWWMCKGKGFEQHSLEDWEKIYDMDGGWVDDDPEEYSILANAQDYASRCEYYAMLRARKAAKKARRLNA